MPRSKKSLIHIGTSGWFYEHWDKSFYKGIPSQERLPFYSGFFSTVELNTTFYHLPTEKSVKNWVKQTPKNFIFSVKASRYITHQKRLLEPDKSLGRFFESIQSLDKKMGPILFQLPPTFQKNLERLTEFLSHLKKHQSVFEFRHDSWFEDEVYDLLHKHNVSLCITDLAGHLTPIEVTGSFAYIRLHGPKKAYSGSYSDRKIKEWGKQLRGWEDQKIATYCYFDNDEKGYAIQDAWRLKEMLLDGGCEL